MAKLVFNRDGGKTDEFGHLLGLSRMLVGEVIDGLQVVANGVPNMSVVVGYGSGAIPAGSAGTAYRYFMGVDANENVTIPTANGSNPRNDLVVAYVDKGVTPSTSFTNNSNAVLKIVVVSGAPAVTPADPSGATIQAAVGAGNPYIILARVLTGAGVTQINNGNITDLRSLAAARILANSITTAMLQDSLITTAKVAANAIDRTKMSAAHRVQGEYSTSELATDATWTDGKVIYKRTFTGTISAAGGTRNALQLVAAGIDKIINYNGYYDEGGGLIIALGTLRMDTSGNFIGGDGMWQITGALSLITKSNTTRTNAPYAVTVFYTKV